LFDNLRRGAIWMSGQRDSKQAFSVLAECDLHRLSIFTALV